ncbi:NADPH-dependent FMN reductase [Novosphingobium kaempferiae]|uniref:NADPH-dependent FMN reductase n=1 Tax=Novosphingobium kaempferiae TaxID=2896849 RepID=UPI001E3DE395|nr:NADPH-dependent FMN reductase [Novosphingobium kaempferiae]
MKKNRNALVVGIGGTIGGDSTTERALRIALGHVEAQGLATRLFGGEALGELPLFNPKSPARTTGEQDLVAAIRSCSGVILATPGYHGSISGALKNALDLLEDTAKDERSYLSGLPVGIVVTAYGWQATGSTLATMRSIVHALRAWPTPFAATINALETRIDADGSTDRLVLEQLCRVGEQVVRFTPQAHPAP